MQVIVSLKIIQSHIYSVYCKSNKKDQNSVVVGTQTPLFHRAIASAVRRWGIQQNPRPHLSARRCVEEKHQQARQAPRARRNSTTSPTTPTTPPPPHPTTRYSPAIHSLSPPCFHLLSPSRFGELLGSVVDLSLVSDFPSRFGGLLGLVVDLGFVGILH